MTTTFYHQEALHTKEEVLQNALFVLDQGWNDAIRACAEAGASVVLPNFEMSTTLLVQTICRQGKSMIATSRDVWDKIQHAFTEYPQLSNQISIFLFDNAESIAFNL